MIPPVDGNEPGQLWRCVGRVRLVVAAVGGFGGAQLLADELRGVRFEPALWLHGGEPLWRSGDAA